MHSNRSAEGVSLITQIFYAAVFFTRYLDLFPIYGLWNFTLKLFYMASSVYIIFVMLRVYARTREREKAWKLGGFCLGVSVIGAPLVMLIFRRKTEWGFSEVRKLSPLKPGHLLSYHPIGFMGLLHHP